MIRTWMRVALANFLLAAILGGLLRYAFVAEIAWPTFRHLMHTHSHVAMLGWLFLALFALLLHAFLPPEQQQAIAYRRQFWLLQVSVIGMFVSFPFQGYAAGSIIASTAHVLFSYWFAWRFWQDLNRWVAPGLARQFAKASLGFLIFSSLGLWAMPPLMILNPEQGTAYYLAVQFYLHFQFNGWFLFAVLALLLQQMQQQGFRPDPKQGTLFFWLMVGSCLLTYALALTWAKPEQLLFYLNGFGAGLQLLALAVGIRLFWPGIGPFLAQQRAWAKPLLLVALACFVFKILIQGAVIVPFVAQVAYTVRNFVIGFFHLILLGVLSHFVLHYAVQHTLIARTRLVKIGLLTFTIGFILSETILMGQGLMFWIGWGFLPAYYESLFAVSALMPLGLAAILIPKPPSEQAEKR